MSEDRAAWVKRVLERDPVLAETLKAFRAVFGATVVKMRHADPELSLGSHLPWQSERGVVPRSPALAAKRSSDKRK